jgi:quinoprotein glucose dehydrogenase
METDDRIRPGEDQGGSEAGHEFNFEDRPLELGGVLFVRTGHSRAEAIDAATGKLKWRYDPQPNTQADVYPACRGVAYYEAPAGVATPCPRRSSLRCSTRG